MIKLFGALALVAALAGPAAIGTAMAGAVAITAAEPVAVVTIPDSWAQSKIDRGVQIKTPDEEIYVWFELVPADQLDALQKEHDAYFAREGVKFTGATETLTREINGRPWSFTELKATSSDGPSIVRYLAINPKVASGKIIMMTYWASEEGHVKHDKAMQALIDSIAFK